MKVHTLVRRQAASMIVGKAFHALTKLRTVSLSVVYGEDGNTKKKEINFNVDQAKKKVSNMMSRSPVEEHQSKGVFTMSSYNYEVIWINEMGEEQSTFHVSESERNAKMQALSDDGYSPVWRDAE